MTRAVLAALASYEWPGNVRELRNVIELVCLLRSGKKVHLADLPAALRQHSRSNGETPGPVKAGRKLDVSVDDTLDQIVQRVLYAAIEAEGGNRSRAARRLGISLRTVQRHLARMPSLP
jgi:DNA-binding NtrC family response regulator